MGQTAKNRAKQIDARNFKYPQLKGLLQGKKQLNLNQIQKNCIIIGAGCAGVVYLYKQLNIVVKVIKNPNEDSILNQVIILDKINNIYPRMFEYLVCKDSILVGFAMRYYDGKKIWQILDDPQNIYVRNPVSRIRLIKKLKLQVQKLQLLNICHGDLHSDNIMIIQPDNKKQDCELVIIDYGLAFQMDSNNSLKPGLTGYKFMVPPQSRRKSYHITTGINAYMFGRVALQLLTFQRIQDYQQRIQQNPLIQLDRLRYYQYHESVRTELQYYLDDNIQKRIKMLTGESFMLEQMNLQYRKNQQKLMNNYQHQNQSENQCQNKYL